MKTNTLKIYAAPVVLLLIAGGLAASPASADSNRAGRSVVTARFAYDPAAPAAQIMHDLARTVDRLCRTPGTRPLYLRQLDDTCVAEAMQDAVSKIGRSDLAQLHARNG
jgi:UrcA family protein